MPVGKSQWLFFLLTSIASISVAVPNKKTKDVKQFSAVSGAEQRGTYDVDPNPFTAVDFRPLEDNMDRWFAQFRSGGHGVGEYSFFPGHNTSMCVCVLTRVDSAQLLHCLFGRTEIIQQLSFARYHAITYALLSHDH